MACTPLDVSAMRSIADRVGGSGSTDILSVCQALGGMTVCASFCQHLEQDKCWNRYVAQLATDTANPGGTLTAWMVLQAARDQCSILSGGGGCPNWAAIEPLKRPYQYKTLCSCAWPDELPVEFLATHPGARVASRLVYRCPDRPPPSRTGHAQDKSSFCARRFDGTFCQLAIDNLGNHSANGHAAGVCGLLADGCAPSYRNHLLAKASERCEAQRQPPMACGKAAAAAYRSVVQRCSAMHVVAHAAVCGPRLECLAPPATCRPNTCGHSPAPVVALAGPSPAGLAAARGGHRGDRPRATAERVAQYRGSAGR